MVVGQDLADRGGQLAGRLGDAVDLDQQDSARVGRIARVVVGLDSADRDVVHHLQGSRHDPVADDGGHGLAGRLDARESRQQGRDAGRDAKQSDLDLRDGAERAFGADEHPAQVEADVVRRVAADPVHAAVGQHHLHAQHVVGRHTVVEAVRPAGVFGRVASDGAGLLARRVGRIEQPVLRRNQGQLLVDHARLDQGGHGDLVDLQDAAHAGDLQRDSAADGHRAAGQASAGSARHDRDVVSGRDLDHRRHMLGRRCEDDRVRHGSLDRAVALEDAQVVGRIDHRLPPDDAAQLFDHGLGEHHAIGASSSGLRSKASKRRVIAPGKPGASDAFAPTTRRSSQRRHSSSDGMRSARSKIASWMRLCGDTWIVYQTDSPSDVTTWCDSSTLRLTGSRIGLASAAARSRAASPSMSVTKSSLNSNS